MEHIPLPVRFVQLKRAGTKLKDDRLYAKIVAIAEEFTNQPLKPRSRYWFFVENPHPDQLAQLNIATNSGNIAVPRIDYEKYSLFEIVTSQTPGNSKAIFSVDNQTREFIVQAIMEMPRKDKAKVPIVAQHEAPINEELAPMEEEQPGQVGQPEDPMNVEPAPGLVPVEEESLVGQPEAPFDYIIADNGDEPDEPKPRVNLFILIPTDQAIINIFHDLLVTALEFRSEVMSDNQRLYSRKQLFEWNVLLFPYSDDRAIYLLQYLRYASEAVLWLFGAQEENLVIVEKIMDAHRDLLQSASTKRKNLALPQKVTLRLEDINAEVHSTLFAIESHCQLTNQLVFDAVQAKNVPGIEKPIRGYFNKWLTKPTLTTMEVYVCFRFENNVTTPLEQVQFNLYLAAMRAGIPIDDFNVYVVVNGSALAYVSCSSSTMWHMMTSLNTLVQELQSHNLALNSVYETTISDIDASMAREDNALYRGELDDLKQQMIETGVKLNAENRIVLFPAELKRSDEKSNQNTTHQLDFIGKDDTSFTQGVIFRDTTRGTDTNTAPTKLALLIGINKYKFIEDLRGAVNDVKLMKKTLIEKFGFEEENIITLLGEDGADESTLPNQKNIRAAFKELIDRSNQHRGSVIAFHYSGHGSVQPNKDKPTGQNETIVPCDSGRLKRDGGLTGDDTQVPPSTDITDDEIRSFLSELSKHAAHVAVIFDSCHSESITRSPKRLHKTRAVLSDSRLGPVNPNHNDRLHEYLPSFNKVVVIAACAYNGLAHEVEHNSESYGALTYYWCRALQDVSMDEPVTYADIFGRVFPLFDNAKQTPKIEGEKMWQLFGTSKLESSNFALVIEQNGHEVQLDVGAVHGATKGSVFALYKPNVRVPDGSSQITATVVFVGSTTLWATLNEYAGHLKGHRAFEIKHAVEDRIAIHLPVNCPDMVRMLLHHRFREVTEDQAELIMREVQPSDAHKFSAYLTLSKPALVVTDKNNNVILPADSSNEKERIANNLLAYALYEKHLHNHNDTPWQDQIEFVLYRSSNTHLQNWTQIRHNGELVEGDFIRFGVRQWSEEKLYFAIIQFDENGAIEQMYPEDHGETSPLPPTEQIVGIPSGNKGYGPVSIDNSIPRRADAVIKAAYKLYVTTAPTNFSYIEQEGYSPTRKAPTKSVDLTDPVEWTSKTIWCTLKHK